MQELRNMKGWLDANPNKRKTHSGMQRFINGWLAKEQNKGGRNNGKSAENAIDPDEEFINQLFERCNC